jgi:hypothetical protein
MGGAPPVPEAPPPPPPPREPDVVGMAPIANPEDMSPAQREAVYGDRYDHPRHGHARRYRQWRGYGRHEWTAHRAHGWAGRPAYAHEHAYRNGAPEHRRRWLSAQRPHHAGPPAPNLRASQPAAVAAPLSAQTSAQPPATSSQDQLQSAFSGAVSKGAVLNVPPTLAQGTAASVTLALPTDLGQVLHDAAAKLGLVHAARHTQVSATLSGQGYMVTPAGPQTQALEAGRAPVFNWQVQPLAPPRSPLKADVTAVLSGAAKRFNLSASVQQALAAAPAVERSVTDRLGQPGFSDLVIPGVGRIPGKSVAIGVLLVLAVVLLAALARRSGAGRAEREPRAHKGAPAQRPIVLGQEPEPGPFPASPAHGPSHEPAKPSPETPRP